MKRSNEVRLWLELLEDRMALSGAFGGAIDAGAPSLTPFPYNGLTALTTTSSQKETGFQNSFASVSTISYVPTASVIQSQMQSLQSQLQSYQAAQTAMIDQFFSQVGYILQQLHLNTTVVV